MTAEPKGPPIFKNLGFAGNRDWVYAKKVTGTYQKLHRWLGVALIGFLIAVPWIRIGGQPAVRVNLPARELLILGTTFTAADGFNIVLLGLLAAFSLFFWTALLGRLWCGYFCPQTVFLEEWIRPLEAIIEGDRAARMRRDNGPWTFDRTWRKVAKFSAFAALSAALGMSVMSWFAGAPEIWTGNGGPMDYTMVGAIGLVAFFDWAWYREQACNYICPYARFQGALTDDHSLVVSYDLTHGEPREKGKAAAKDGRCVDCGQCVTVCPQGIDIRDGYQLECINCARCIDACTDVMAKFEKPSLVKYTTVAAEQGKKTRFFRGRTVVYAALLTGLTAALFARVSLRNTFEANVNRLPGTLYTVDDDGWVRNTYLLSFGNNAHDTTTFSVSIEGLPDADVTASDVTVAAGQWQTAPLIVRVPANAVDRSASLTVHVSDGTDEILVPASFKAPPLHGGN